MKKQLLELEKKAIEELELLTEDSELEKFRVTYLGKKGLLTSFMKKLGELPAGERPEMGRLANQIKGDLSKRLETAIEGIEAAKAKKTAFFDVTLPGRQPLRGHLHPITLVIQEVCRILSRMGFRVVKGPNVELD
jgi:phenylalanyl-tRNA synthetase alpha chain